MPTLQWNPAYRPTPASIVGDVRAVQAAYDQDPRRPCNDEQAAELGIAHRMAFASILAGDASQQNWATVVCALNIAIVLADRGLGDQYAPLINAALEGAFRAKARGDKTGKYGFDGAAIQAIQDTFDVHEAQIELATKTEMMEAVHEVHRRVDAGFAYKEVA